MPYADLNNPQSLNLYSYVHNNPLSNTDADGHLAENESDPQPGSGGPFSPQDGRQQMPACTRIEACSDADLHQGSEAAQQKGSGTAGTIYNETSTLREDGKTVGPELHNARVAIAQVIDVNHSTAKVASSTVQDNLKYPPAGAAMKDSQAAVSEAATAPNGTQGATHFFLAGGNTPTPAWVSQGKVVESFGPFPVAANTHDFSKGQSATIQIIQYPVPKP